MLMTLHDRWGVVIVFDVGPVQEPVIMVGALAAEFMGEMMRDRADEPDGEDPHVADEEYGADRNTQAALRWSAAPTRSEPCDDTTITVIAESADDRTVAFAPIRRDVEALPCRLGLDPPPRTER